MNTIESNSTESSIIRVGRGGWSTPLLGYSTGSSEISLLENGTKMHFDEIGKPLGHDTKWNIFLFHGNPSVGNARFMHPSFVYTSRNTGIAMPTRFGNGLSSELPATLEQYDALELNASAVRQIMDQRGVTECHAASRSGGVIHALYLAAIDNRVKSVVAYAPAMSRQMAMEILGEEWAHGLDTGNAKVSAMDYPNVKDQVQSNAATLQKQHEQARRGGQVVWEYPGGLTPKDIDDIRDLLDTPPLSEESLLRTYMSATNNGTSVDGWAHDAHMLLGGEWPIQWSEIRVPVLLVGYTKDRFAPPGLVYAFAKYLQKRGIKVSVEMREGGHFKSAKDQKNVDTDVRRLHRTTE